MMVTARLNQLISQFRSTCLDLIQRHGIATLQNSRDQRCGQDRHDNTDAAGKFTAQRLNFVFAASL